MTQNLPPKQLRLLLPARAAGKLISLQMTSLWRAELMANSWWLEVARGPHHGQDEWCLLLKSSKLITYNLRSSEDCTISWIDDMGNIRYDFNLMQLDPFYIFEADTSNNSLNQTTENQGLTAPSKKNATRQVTICPIPMTCIMHGKSFLPKMNTTIWIIPSPIEFVLAFGRSSYNFVNGVCSHKKSPIMMIAILYYTFSKVHDWTAWLFKGKLSS